MKAHKKAIDCSVELFSSTEHLKKKVIYLKSSRRTSVLLVAGAYGEHWPDLC